MERVTLSSPIVRPTYPAFHTTEKLIIYFQNACILANNKFYDGTTNATLNFINAKLLGVYAGDDVRLNTTDYRAWFEEPDPGTHIEVYVGGLQLLGSDAPNYRVLDPTDVHADIFALPTPTTIGVSPGDVFPTDYVPSDYSRTGLEANNEYDSNDEASNQQDFDFGICNNVNKTPSIAICHGNKGNRKLLWTSINATDATITAPIGAAALLPGQVYIPPSLGMTQ